MKYAGFWKRFCAAWIDLFIMMPFVFLFVLLMGLGKEVAVILWILSPALYYFYYIYFHGKWGATVGKMAMKIKVVGESDGTDISFPEAFLRFSVYLFLTLFLLIGNMVVLTSLSSSEYSSLSWLEYVKKFDEMKPEWAKTFEFLFEIWILIDPLVLLFNKRKRAIHDFIAGTVVIHKETQPTIELIPGVISDNIAVPL